MDGVTVNFSFDISHHLLGSRLHVVPSINIDFMQLLGLSSFVKNEIKLPTISLTVHSIKKGKKHIEVI